MATPCAALDGLLTWMAVWCSRTLVGSGNMSCLDGKIAACEELTARSTNSIFFAGIPRLP